MKVVVGLGNPGQKYEGTRHNVGWDVLRELNRRWSGSRPKSKFEAEIVEITLGPEKVLLVAPQTYMNLSGRSVRQLVDFYQLPLGDLTVVCDDINLKLGQVRLRGSGSAGGQKGLNNIIQQLRTEEFPRLRIGVDRPPAGVDAADFVLARFRKEEIEPIDQAILRAANGVELWVREGLDRAMNMVNGPGEELK